MQPVNKKPRIPEAVPEAIPGGACFGVSPQGRGDPLRALWMNLVVQVAQGNAVLAPVAPGAASAAAACVAAVVCDPLQRLTGLGGREGMPLSFASPYAGAITRCLTRRHTIVTSERAPHVDGEEYSRFHGSPYPAALAAVGGGVYALMNHCASVEAGLLTPAPDGTVAVEVRCVGTHAVVARLDVHALQLGRVMQLALHEGPLVAGAAGAGSGCVTLLLAGSQPTAGQGRVVAVQLEKQQQQHDGPWPYVVHAPMDHTRTTLTGVTTVRPQGPDGALQGAVIVAASPTGSVVVFRGKGRGTNRGKILSASLGAPAAMCSMLQPGSGRLGACFAVVETSRSCVSICRVVVDAEGCFSLDKLWCSTRDVVLYSPSFVTCTGGGELLVHDLEPQDATSSRWWHREKQTHVFAPCADGDGGGVGARLTMSPAMKAIGRPVAGRGAMVGVSREGAVTMHVK
jgi:hypothetical protein